MISKKLPFTLFIVFFCIGAVSAQLPVINSFQPESAPVGALVTINGNNFDVNLSNNIVFFGAAKASISTATPTKLTVVVPPGASYKPISVTVNGLTAFATKSFIVKFSGGSFPITSSTFEYAAHVDSLENTNTTDILSDDFDSDGKVDMAIVDENGNLLSFYANTSNGRQISFGPKLDFVTSSPRSLAEADFDGDGRRDIVVTNIKDSVISIFKNTSAPGSISFTPWNKYATTTQPADVVCADFDNDGKVDLAVSTIDFEGTLCVIKNTTASGNISFGEATKMKIGGPLGNLKAIQLNDDGKTDLVLTNFLLNVFSILKNTSNSDALSFQHVTTLATGEFPIGLTVGDLDGDNKEDFAVANFLSSSISVFRNTSSGSSISFERKNFAEPDRPEDIATGDMDGDGHPDLAVINNTGAVSIFINYSQPGIASFGRLPNMAGNIISKRILIANFDNDGKPDLAGLQPIFRALIFSNTSGEPQVSSFAPGIAGNGTTVIIQGTDFKNVSGVRFGGVPASSFKVINSTTISAVVAEGASGYVTITTDWGVDSLAGFIFTSLPIITSFSPAVGGSGTIIHIYGANLHNTTAINFGATAAASFQVISPSEMTAVVGTGSSGDVQVVLPTGTVRDSGFVFSTSPIITGFTPALGIPGASVTITGANFDSIADSNIVYFGGARASVTSASPNRLTVTVPPGATYQRITITTNKLTGYSGMPFMPTYAGTANLNATSFSGKTEFTIGGPSYCVQLNDCDQDGKLDLSATSYENPKKISVFRNTSTKGDLSFEQRIDSSTVGFTSFIATGDLNGDGKLDHAVSNNQISIFENKSSPGFISFDSRLDINTRSSLVGKVNIDDINMDGKPDLFYARYLLELFPNTTQNKISFGNGIRYDLGFSNYLGAVDYSTSGDLNGDGKTDIIVLNGYRKVIGILKNTSNSSRTSFDESLEMGTWGRPAAVALGDINADGKPDLVVVQSDADKLSIYKNTGNNGSIAFDKPLTFETPGSPESVGIADVNGDGKPDVLVTASLPNTVSIFQNTSVNGDISFKDKINYLTGGMPEYVTVGDLDNDGKPDIAAATYSRKSISILRNEVGETIPTRVDISYCNKGNISFTSNISGATYQWQENNGDGYVNMVNSETKSGVNNATLSLANVPDSMNGWLYHCKINGGVLLSSTYVLKPNAIPYPPTLYQQGNYLYALGGSDYKWYLNDTLMAGVFGVGYSPTVNGVYTVTSTVNGCTSAASNPINYVMNVVTGINSPQLNSQLWIGPNPVRDRLMIRHDGNPSTFEVLIEDMNGNTVIGTKVFTRNVELDMRHLHHGLYIVKIRNKKTSEQAVRRIVR